ncbi:MAG TPA: type II toxin-antitoxin system Phd/YefM family antitoxin [Spirochaetes bacterium]|nr:type II toxin-antitoxin system Phd/YefM family antitoxin [Spirochaetota bacterium]
MSLYSASKAEEDFPFLLDQALKEGEVKIKRKDGRIFVIKPEPVSDSPLNVDGIHVNLNQDEIIQFIHEARPTK